MKEKPRNIIICDTELCNGCRICEYACAAYKDKSMNLRHSRMKVVRIEPIVNIAMSCVNCDDPDCVKGCPVQAITYDEKEKIIKIDEDRCTACGLCITRCQYGSITLALNRKNAFVCDFCKEFDKPKCVEFCPKGALTFEPATDLNFQGIIRKLKKDE